MKIRALGLLAAIVAVGALTACAPPPPPPAPWIAAGTCFDGVDESSPTGAPVTDVEYLGPDNSLGNFSYWSSTDGSCSGEPDIVGSFAIVEGTDLAAAQTVCASIARPGFSGNAFSIQGAWPSLPDTAWGCTG